MRLPAGHSRRAETAKPIRPKPNPCLPLPALKRRTASEERPLTTIILTVTPAETAIYIDGKFWGLAPEAGKIENLRL